MSISVLCCIPNPNDATSYYRAMGPLTALKRSMGLNLRFDAKVTWATMKQVDAVFLQRPSSVDDVKIIEIAKNCGVPVWVDYDDNLLEVTPDNPSFFHYFKSDMKKRITFCLSSADAVSVSTKELGRCFSVHNKNIHVIPNAVDDQKEMFLNPPQKDGPKKVLWRGTNTHAKDIWEYSDQIIGVAKANKDVSWNFMGFYPWFLADKLGKVEVSAPTDIMNFFHALKNARPSVVMVPLCDTVFNRCKSNIAWLESTWAGALVVAPNWEEWAGLVYYDKESFIYSMNQAIGGSGSSSIVELVKSHQDHIRKTLTLPIVNKQREELLRCLVS